MKTKHLQFILINLFIFVSLAISQLQYRCGSSEEYCRDDQTCCLITQDIYGCCPYSNGVCCEDGQHCCPQNYVCNLHLLRCEKQDKELFLKFLMTTKDNSGFIENNMIRINKAGMEIEQIKQ